MAVGKGLGAAKAAVEEAQKNNQQVKYPAFSLRIPEGETSIEKRVRFLNAEDVITFIEHWTEYKNTWKRNYACPNEGVLGADKCMTCRGKKGEDFVNDQRKHAHMINLINRESGQVEVWKFSPMVMAALLEKNDELGSITDRDFLVKFMANEDENIKAKFVYVVSPATAEAEPLSKADKALTPFDLESLIPKYDEENLKRIASMTPEQSKKGVQKAGSTASDFAANILGNKGAAQKSLLDDFASITKAKAAKSTEAAAESAGGEDALAEFNSILEQM